MKTITGSPAPPGFFVFNDKTTRHVLAFNTIVWLQATRYYTIIHRKENGFIVCSQNIGDMEDQFIRSGFYRVHRSYMVNLNEVVTFENRQLLLSDDTTLIVAHRVVTDFLRAYYEINKLTLRRGKRVIGRVG
jgi:two-component system, LytTR family, response regulator